MFFVQVSVVSFVSVAVPGMLQIACHVTGDSTRIQCEMAYISNLSKCVWEIIGLVLGLRLVGLRSAAIAWALTSSCELLLQKTVWQLSVDCYEGKLQAFFFKLSACRTGVVEAFVSSVAWSSRCKNSCLAFTCFVI